MPDVEILSCEKLPADLQFFADRKARSLLLAEKIEHCFPHWAERLRNCADTLRVIRYKNNYCRLDTRNQRFCRLRGCPFCDEQLRRKRAGLFSYGYKQVKKEFPKLRVGLLQFQSKPIYLRSLKSAIYNAIDPASIKILRRKIVRRVSFGYLSFIRVIPADSPYKCSIKCAFWFAFKSSFFSGRYYISRSRWEDLWNESIGGKLPPFEAKLTPLKTPERAVGAAKHLCVPFCPLDFPDRALPDLLSQMQNVQCFRRSGEIRPYFKARTTRPKKKYYPSEIANFNRQSRDYYTYVADLKDPELSDTYIYAPELRTPDHFE